MTGRRADGVILSGAKNLFPRQQTRILRRFAPQDDAVSKHPLLLPQAQMVRDHGDELAIGGFSLDAGNRVAEELLCAAAQVYCLIRCIEPLFFMGLFECYHASKNLSILSFNSPSTDNLAFNKAV